MVNAKQVLAEAEKRGAHFSIVGERLKAEPASALDATLIASIAKLKPEIVAELRRRPIAAEATSLDPDQQVYRCGFCMLIGFCYSLDDGTLVCPACAEWRVTCPAFIISRAAPGEKKKAACISCGGSWEVHGRPGPNEWRLVDDIEAVPLFEARFVLAKASEIIATRNE